MHCPTIEIIAKVGEVTISHIFTQNGKEVVVKESVGDLSETYFLEEKDIDIAVVDFAHYMLNTN